MKAYSLDGQTVWVTEQDLFKILNKREAAFMASGSIIPFNDPDNLWLLSAKINQKVLKALRKKRLKYEVIEVQKQSSFNVISDDLGTKGVKNMATGEMFNSKSSYYKSVKAAGCEIVGNDPIPDKPREQRGDYDCRADVARAIEQVGWKEGKRGR